MTTNPSPNTGKARLEKKMIRRKVKKPKVSDIKRSVCKNKLLEKKSAINLLK